MDGWMNFVQVLVAAAAGGRTKVKVHGHNVPFPQDFALVLGGHFDLIDCAGSTAAVSTPTAGHATLSTAAPVSSAHSAVQPCFGKAYRMAGPIEISDGSAELNYWPNSLCEWVLDVSACHDCLVELSFTQFDIEDQYDSISVYAIAHTPHTRAHARMRASTHGTAAGTMQRHRHSTA